MIALPILLFVAATILRHFSTGPPGAMRGAEEENSFITIKLHSDDILVTISATGTLEPEEVIDVGAQVAGQILSFGQDVDNKTIDYGSRVEKDMVLARIDDTFYAAGVSEAKARILGNKATLLRGNANLIKAESNFVRAELDWKRAQHLGPSEALAKSKFDNYKSIYEIAKAEIAVKQAEIEQFKADLAQSEATLHRAQRSFDYCTIRSPVKGVIIDRRVNIGQTVVASLNAPSLFLLAKDLRKMEIWVAVNEADIGKIKPGGNVSYTIDAFPGEKFHGKVRMTRLNAGMTQNVVSYTVVVTTDNKDGRLLPYLTANVLFELNRRENVLTVPKAVLKWTPPVDLISLKYRQTYESLQHDLVWVMDGQHLRPIEISTGLSDGVKIEIESMEIYDGLKIVTGLREGKRRRGKEKNNPDANKMNNPFAPNIPKRPGGQSGPGGPGGPGR